MSNKMPAEAQTGFTLIELMIVVAIVAILAAIAYPSYQAHVVKTRRTTAAACMLEAAQFMERFYTTHLRYDQTRAGVAVALPGSQCQTDLQNFYVLQLNAAANTYTVQAVPQGQQALRDTKCATLSVNQAGVKAETGSASSASECW